MNGSNSLSLEALAARQLLDALADLDGGDVLDQDGTVLETAVEGETNFYEAVDAALAELREIEIQRAGIRQVADTLELRESRLGDKAQRIKQQLLAAIETAGVPTPLRRPCATVSVTKGRAKVVVTDPEAIPVPFRRIKTAWAPDTKLIQEALEIGHDVPGACMSNACPSLTIRTR